MAVETRGPEIEGIAYASVILSSIATILRVYCRAWVTKAFSADDWLAVIAQILFIVYCAHCIAGVQLGTGKHVPDIPPDQVAKTVQLWWTCEPTYALTNMAIKASIGLFLLRICVHRVQRWTIWAVIVLIEVYSFVFFFLFILQCRPTSLFWLRYNSDPPKGTCWDAGVIARAFVGYSVVSCITDWTYSILPIFLVWNLQMNKRLKISVVALLATGTLASTATIVRFRYLYTLTDVEDFLYSTSDFAIWSTVETCLAITTAAVATLRPLFRTVFGGSTAPSAGASTRQWHRTGSNHAEGGDVFDLHQVPGGQYGVSTVIDSGKQAVDIEATSPRSNSDNISKESFSTGDGWNNSQSNLAERISEGREAGPWDITVKKSIVQTRA